jgi:hypothetical protein
VLRLPCPECGTPNVSGALFCSTCSEELPPSHQAPAQVPEFPGASSATTGVLGSRAAQGGPPMQRTTPATPTSGPASSPTPSPFPAPIPLPAAKAEASHGRDTSNKVPSLDPRGVPSPSSKPPAATAKKGFVWDDEAPADTAAQRSVVQPPSPAPAPPLRANVWFGRYEDPVEIGRGGAGTVFRARDIRTGQLVALKQISEDSGFHAARIRREVDARRLLTHPGIVRVLDLIADAPSEVCLVMEYVGGGDLQHRIDEQGALPFDVAVDLACKLAEILGHAHEKGVIHRDLKPANVLLDEQGNPHVTDFGLARGPGITSLTTEGQVLGTYDFMAPEQRRDATAADARSDIYALGKTLYCALTGQPPYTVRESRVPVAIRDTILRCLEDEPSRRYPSMRALSDDLARLSAPRVPAFELIALDRDDKPVARFELHQGQNIVGVRADGNEPEVDLTAVDKHQIVSRRHARIDVRAAELVLTHLSGTNPTHLNGRLVRPDTAAALAEGDKIVLSTNVVLEVRRS